MNPKDTAGASGEGDGMSATYLYWFKRRSTEGSPHDYFIHTDDLRHVQEFVINHKLDGLVIQNIWTNSVYAPTFDIPYMRT